MAFKYLCFSVLTSFAILGCAADSSNRTNLTDSYNLRPGATNDVLATDNFYASRFMEKHRLSFNWLSGPGIRNCLIPGNVYKRLGGYGKLGDELNAPLFETAGRLSYAYKYNDRSHIEVKQLNSFVLGENSEGKFEKFRPFCSDFFSDSAIGFGLYIIEPDNRKGTSYYTDGGVPVNVNGLLWSKKTLAAERDPKYPNAVPVEIWVLKIPDTKYWLIIKLSIRPKYTLEQYGIDYRNKLLMFHKIVESVQLDPITSIDFAELHK